jgi:hypothetical protein
MITLLRLLNVLRHSLLTKAGQGVGVCKHRGAALLPLKGQRCWRRKGLIQ